MADIPLGALQGGSSDGFALNGAQAFTNPNVGLGGILGYQSGTFDVSAGLTNVINLTGKHVLTYAALSGINTTSGTLQIQLVVDGATLGSLSAASNTLSSVNVVNAPYTTVKCNSSLQLKVTKPLATAVSIQFISLAVL